VTYFFFNWPYYFKEKSRYHKKYKWLRKETEPRDITWKASLPKATDIQLPIDLFRTFITDSMVAGLVDPSACNKENKR